MPLNPLPFRSRSLRRTLGGVLAVLLLSGAVAALLSGRSVLAAPNDAALDAIQRQLEGGKAAEALPALENLADLTPSQSIRQRYYRADALRRLGKDAEAIVELNAFLPPLNATAAQRAGFVAAGGTYGEQARALLGDLYGKAGQHDRRILLYRALIEDDPANPKWKHLLGDAFFDSGRFDLAAAQYGLVAADHPDYAGLKEASFRKAEALRRAKRYQEEYDYLLALPKGRGPDWEILAGVRRAESLSLYLRREFPLSNRIVEDLIAKYPNHPDIHLAQRRLGLNALRDLPVPLQEIERGRSVLNAVVAQHPRSDFTLSTKLEIALSYLRQRDHSNARAQFLALLAEYPDQDPTQNVHAPQLRYLLGDLYLRNQQRDEAIGAWEALVQQYPDNAWAAVARQRLAAVKTVGVRP